MEDWKDWLENKMRRGDVCQDYMRAISSCKNRQQFFELFNKIAVGFAVSKIP